MGAQEIYDELVEAGWILDAAGVAGLGQDLVYGARNQRGGALAAFERVVVFAVDH